MGALDYKTRKRLKSEERLHPVTRSARRLRNRLIALLGGRCAACGEEDRDKLEFDHVEGIGWVARERSYYARLKEYEREISRGWIQLLCGDCNKGKRMRDADRRRGQMRNYEG